MFSIAFLPVFQRTSVLEHDLEDLGARRPRSLVFKRSVVTGDGVWLMLIASRRALTRGVVSVDMWIIKFE